MVPADQNNGNYTQRTNKMNREDKKEERLHLIKSTEINTKLLCKLKGHPNKHPSIKTWFML